MENLEPFHSQLKNLQSQAKKLTESGLALNALFAEEETRLKREDEVSILRVVHCAIVEQLQRLKNVEASASLSYSQANLILYLGELAVTAIASKGNRLSAIRDYLIRKATDRKEPFGLVMVCIGPRGLPDDARVIPISQLARESNRSQPEIIGKLQENGYLLFSGEAFSILIDRLVVDVREGKLHLPASRNKLAEIMVLSKPKPSIKLIQAK